MAMSRGISLCREDSGRRAERFGEPAVKHIGIVLYDGFSLVGVGTLTEALHVANELQRSADEKGLTYSVSLVSARGGLVACSSSISVCTERLDAERSVEFDTLYVAGGNGATLASRDDRLIELLKLAGSEGSAICALGNGHALLTAADLSSDTSASFRSDISTYDHRNKPRNERSDALVYSAALIKRDLGYDIASSVADRLVEKQHVSIMLTEMRTPSVAEKAQESARWLERNCGRSVSVEDAANTAAMSGRNFSRLFKREMGLTPSQYLLRARLRLSCELLANSELPIDKIARRTGLSNGERMSKLFKKQFSMSPSEYRARKRDGSLI
jgi:transcriptional regulator GlxA family with amidase domain